MKKLPLLFFCVIFIFCGCETAPKPPCDKFSSKFTAKYNGERLSGEICSSSNSTLTLSLSSPEALKGCTYFYKGDKLRLTYKNFKLKAEPGYFGEKDFSLIVFNVIKSLKNEENYTLEGVYNSNSEYKGSCGSGKYRITCDKATGLIKQISLKENKCIIKLK